MYKRVLACCLVVMLSVGALQAQSPRLSIRPASVQPVDGWQRMQVEHSNRVVWVSPTATLTTSDIEKVQPETRANGFTVVAVMFTDVGASKMRDLTTAQLTRPIALIVDGRVIWCPTLKTVFIEGISTASQCADWPHARRG